MSWPNLKAAGWILAPERVAITGHIMLREDVAHKAVRCSGDRFPWEVDGIPTLPVPLVAESDPAPGVLPNSY